MTSTIFLHSIIDKKSGSRERSWLRQMAVSTLAMLCLIASLSLQNNGVVHAGTFVQQKNQNKTLVLVDTWATLETHSIFFEHIKTMGAGNHTLEFKLISGNPSDAVGIQ